MELPANIRFNPGAGQKNSISYEIRATKTSAYQAVKLGPLSREMNNSFAEKMLGMCKIYQPYYVFSFLYTFYMTIYLFIYKIH